MFKSVIGVAAALLLWIVNSQAFAQTWNYRSYYVDGASGKQSIYTGFATLEEKDAGAIFRIVAPGLNKCFRDEMKATVDRRDQTLIKVVAEPLLLGCPPVRFVIKADGSGGIRELQQDGQWSWDKTERDLSLRM